MFSSFPRVNLWASDTARNKLEPTDSFLPNRIFWKRKSCWMQHICACHARTNICSGSKWLYVYKSNNRWWNTVHIQRKNKEDVPERIHVQPKVNSETFTLSSGPPGDIWPLSGSKVKHTKLTFLCLPGTKTPTSRKGRLSIVESMLNVW